MQFDSPTSPHGHARTSVTRVMLRVIYALIPGIAAYIYFFGWGVAINILLACVVALVCEGAVLRARSRPVWPFITDGSAVVTAMLLALALPPLSPWWLTLCGTAFAIVIGKQLYGGLGYNPFNPAMLGYVMLLISFPLEMTSWTAPQMLLEVKLGLIDAASAIFAGRLPEGLPIDAFTMASPLDTLKTQLLLDQTVSNVIATSPIFGNIGGKGWEWISGGFLIGGLWLIYMKVISWHIPAAMLGALFTIAEIFYLIDANTHATPWFHLVSGATMLGAFFIATDPVSAATTNPGRLVYAAGIGILVYVIRAWGGYPDGVAFAVLLMNMTAPTIDYYFRPRVFGHDRK